MNPETKLQKKIVDELKKRGYQVYRQSYAPRAGTPDILACAPNGIFCGFEVKTPKGKTTPLQDAHLKQIEDNLGIGRVIRSIEDLPSDGLLSLRAEMVGDSA